MTRLQSVACFFGFHGWLYSDKYTVPSFRFVPMVCCDCGRVEYVRDNYRCTRYESVSAMRDGCYDLTLDEALRLFARRKPLNGSPPQSAVESPVAGSPAREDRRDG